MCNTGILMSYREKERKGNEMNVWGAVLLFAVANPWVEIDGLHQRDIETPVRMELSTSDWPGDGDYCLVLNNGEGESEVPIQYVKALNQAVFVLPPAGDGTEETLKLPVRETDTQAGSEGFRFEMDENRLHLFEDGRPVLSYVFGMVLPEGVPENRRRSSYIHPIYGLDGEMLTDDFPRDHYHHRGLHWAWPRVMIDGKRHDLWHLDHIGHRFEDLLYKEAGPVCAAFGFQNGWYTENGKAMDERVDVLVYRASNTGRAMDVKLTWSPVDEEIAIIGQSQDDKGYGGLNYRAAPRTDTRLTAAGWRQPADSDRIPFPWADLSAKYQGGDGPVSGFAIFSHHENPGFPEGWTLRHYGFLGVAWPGLDPWTLKPEDTLTLRFRTWAHRGGAGEGKTGAAYAAFAHPYQSIRLGK